LEKVRGRIEKPRFENKMTHTKNGKQRWEGRWVAGVGKKGI